MPDMEKVIKAIDICLGHGKCHDCHYSITEKGYTAINCRECMMRDALALLKEQDKTRLEIAHEIVSGSILMYQGKEIIRCKDCKHFEIKDHWADFGGVPILAASDCPTCNKWADGCKTKPDGYCFMAERRD